MPHATEPEWLLAACVVMPERAVNPASQRFEEGVVHRDQHRLAGLREAVHDQAREPQPELVHRPARTREEPVRAGVMPDPR